MFEGIVNFFKKLVKQDKEEPGSKSAAKERLHLVLMQDRANVSADFLELMKQEIIEVIKKYIEVDEAAIDVRLTNKVGEDGEHGAPALYANIPILNIKNDMKKINPNSKDGSVQEEKVKEEKTENKEELKEEEKNKEQQIEENENNNEDIIDNKEEEEKEDSKEDSSIENEEETQKEENKDKEDGEE